MLRFTALFVAGCIATIAMLAASSRQPAPAGACSLAPTVFDDLAKQVPLIVLADVQAVGGPVNSAPTLAPTSTPSATPTDTPAPGATRTPRPSATPRTRTPTPLPPSVTPTSTPPPYYDLTGMRATLDVVQTYAGDSPTSPLVIDAEQRARFERGLRAIEADQRSICGPFPVVRYSAGARYIILAAYERSGAAATSMRLRVEGDDVILCDSTRPDDRSCPQMHGTAYRRFFAGVGARIDHGTEEDFATITAARMPLARFVSALEAIRNGSNITPPETGSAGLAAHHH
jgi:hypothetical protein